MLQFLVEPKGTLGTSFWLLNILCFQDCDILSDDIGLQSPIKGGVPFRQPNDKAAVF